MQSSYNIFWIYKLMVFYAKRFGKKSQNIYCTRLEKLAFSNLVSNFLISLLDYFTPLLIIISVFFSKPVQKDFLYYYYY